MGLDKREELRIFGRFCLIGLVCSATEVAVFYLLLQKSIGLLPAQMLSYTVTTFVSYSFNRRFTFRSDSRYFGREIGRFFAVSAAALALSAALVWLLSDGFGLRGTPTKEWGVKLAAMMFSAAVNYLGARLWVFKIEARDQRQEVKKTDAKRIHS